MATIEELLRVIADREASVEARVAAGHELALAGDRRVREPKRILAGKLWHKAAKDERPEARHVAEFALAPFPVTVAEFATFIEAGGYDDAGSWSSEGWSWRLDEDIVLPRFWGEREWAAYLVANHPVVGVSAFEAEAFAAFHGARLPTELEWERACRGDDAREYPWGDDWDEHATSHRDYGPRSTLPVGVCPRGVSPFGIHDLCGNVWQWTSDERGEAEKYGRHRVARGGAWNNLPWSMGCAGRNAFAPTARFSNLGFRLAFDVPPPAVPRPAP